MASLVRKGSQVWLSKQDPNDPSLHKAYRRSVIYFRRLYQAWPEWCADHPEFKRIYSEATSRRKSGEDVQVDHIVPICSPWVCGLHVPWNLEIISRADNIRKSNHTWPGHPFENLELF